MTLYRSHIASDDQRPRWIGAIGFDPDRFVATRCGRTFHKDNLTGNVVDPPLATCRSCTRGADEQSLRPIRPRLTVVR